MTTPKLFLAAGGLVLIVASLPAAESPVQQTLAAARQAARQDRNTESAALFRKAIQQDPSCRLEVARELADQLTYTDRAAEAIPLYRETLEKSRLSRDDVRRAHLGLGLALGRTGNLEEALAEYDLVLAANPNDTDAKRERVQRIVDAARTAAGHDLNQESAALFARAIAEAPARRAEWLCELAEQLTYSKKPVEAIPLFREILGSQPATGDVRRARLGLALALAWTGRFEASLKEYDLLLAADPGDREAAVERTRRLVDRARDAAHHDRNAEAARLYEDIVQQNPGLRMSLAREWADQLTYSGREGEAIPLFREVIGSGETKPQERRSAALGLALALSYKGELKSALAEYDSVIREDSTDVQAHLGRARVLSWMDKLGPAKEEYETALRLDPGNAEAAKGLARVQSWRGRQRDAQRKLEEYLSNHPHDIEAAILLSQAKEWMGRPGRAAQTAREAVGRDSNNRDAFRRLEQLQYAMRSASRTGFRHSSQSDGLNITQWTAVQGLHTGSPDTSLEMVYESDRYTPAAGAGIVVSRPGMKLAHRFSDNLELHADVFLDRVRTRDNGAEHTLPTFNAWFTLWSGDAVRFDLGANRSTFDNLKSLSRGIVGDFGAFSMDLTPNEKTVISTRFNFGVYSDGNRRGWGQVEWQQRIRTHPTITIGARYTTFGFTRILDNGYFNPSRYQSAAATVHLSGRIGHRLRYDLDGSAGAENATPGGGKPLTTECARLAYRLSVSLELEGRFEHFSSRSSSSSGFARSTAYVAMNYRW